MTKATWNPQLVRAARASKCHSVSVAPRIPAFSSTSVPAPAAASPDGAVPPAGSAGAADVPPNEPAPVGDGWTAPPWTWVGPAPPVPAAPAVPDGPAGSAGALRPPLRACHAWAMLPVGSAGAPVPPASTCPSDGLIEEDGSIAGDLHDVRPIPCGDGDRGPRADLQVGGDADFLQRHGQVALRDHPNGVVEASAEIRQVLRTQGPAVAPSTTQAPSRTSAPTLSAAPMNRLA